MRTRREQEDRKSRESSRVLISESIKSARSKQMADSGQRPGVALLNQSDLAAGRELNVEHLESSGPRFVGAAHLSSTHWPIQSAGLHALLSCLRCTVHSPAIANSIPVLSSNLHVNNRSSVLNSFRKRTAP